MSGIKRNLFVAILEALFTSSGESESGDDNDDVVYRVQDTSMYINGTSGYYASSEYNGIKDVDRLKQQHPDRTYRLIAVNNRTGKMVGVLYSR